MVLYSHSLQLHHTMMKRGCSSHVHSATMEMVEKCSVIMDSGSQLDSALVRSVPIWHKVVQFAQHAKWLNWGKWVALTMLTLQMAPPNKSTWKLRIYLIVDYFFANSGHLNSSKKYFSQLSDIQLMSITSIGKPNWKLKCYPSKVYAFYP